MKWTGSLWDLLFGTESLVDNDKLSNQSHRQYDLRRTAFLRMDGSTDVPDIWFQS